MYLSLCGCGKTSFRLLAKPIARWVCHCLYCQAFTGQPAADDCAFWPGQVQGVHRGSIIYTKSAARLAMERGRCAYCGDAVIAVFRGFWGMQCVFVPSKNIQPRACLPAVTGHTFYHRRVFTPNDAAPRFSGYWRSQWHCLRVLLMAGLKRWFEPRNLS